MRLDYSQDVIIVQTNVKEIESEYQQLFSPQSHRMTIAEPRPVALYQVTEGGMRWHILMIGVSIVIDNIQPPLTLTSTGINTGKVK